MLLSGGDRVGVVVEAFGATGGARQRLGGWLWLRLSMSLPLVGVPARSTVADTGCKRGR